MDTLLNLKSNLIQNFYILGFNPSKFFQINEGGKGVFLNIFKDQKMELVPEVISKFPPENGNYNSCKDEVVLAHCFPHGLSVMQTNEEKKPCSFFEFHLDNILFNYNEEDKRLYSKIYFTCLTLYESLELYLNYKTEIITTLNNDKNTNIKVIQDENAEPIKLKNSPFLKTNYIKKTICFASLMPFTKELRNILKIIYQLYCVKTRDSSTIPLEKFLEQLILQTPLPLGIGDQFEIQIKMGIDLEEKLNKKTMKQKSKSSGNLLISNLSFMKKGNIGDPLVKIIKFPLFNLNEAYHKYANTISFEECFSYFQVDDIIRIYRYILLEIPILFFCLKKEILSNFIENLLGFLSPFNYALPNVSILSDKFYGLINSEYKFIFGINEKYRPKFFKEHNIDIDKNMIVVYIDPDNKTESKIEEILKINNQEEKNYLTVDSEKGLEIYSTKMTVRGLEINNMLTNDYVIFDKMRTELISIEFPSDIRRKLSAKISSILLDAKKKSRKGEIDENFNIKIHQAFYKFLVGILNGYCDYLLKSRYFYEAIKTGNCGDNMRYKSQTSNISDINFLKELFNIDEFVKNCSRDLQPFYYTFFHTKLFLYYLRDRIYFSDDFNSLPYYQFDQYIYLKRHKDIRKKHKDLYDKLKKGNFEKPKTIKTIEIIIKTGFNFTEQEMKTIIDNKTEVFLKYAQYIHLNENKKEKGIRKISYALFPKLLFDDSFFEMNYETSYFLHGIMLPSDKHILEFKNQCKLKVESYKKNLKFMLYPNLVENLKPKSKADFTVDVYEYVQFNWLILLCCSLWYCEPMEREVRMDKIFEILDKISYLEEMVIIFIYINFLKYGTKTQCIKMMEKINKFLGHSNYLFLILLCLKLEEENNPNPDNNNLLNKNEDNENNIIINDNKNNINNTGTYILKARSIILSNENFFQRRCSMPTGINFSDINSPAPKLSMLPPSNYNKKNPKSFHIANPNLNKEITHKEKIIFNQAQLCPKCKEITYFDPSEIIGLTIDGVKVNFEYICKKCGNKKNSINIKYQILLINNRKNQSFVTKLGEFQLLSPYRLYTNLKYDQLNMKDYSLKINNIYNEKRNELFNYIFYFCRKNLAFDFLIPYKPLNNMDLELIENRLGSIISDINRKRFSIINQMSPDNLTKEMENEFVPINISENSNFDKNIFDDLIPIYTAGVSEGIYGNSIEGENNGEKNVIKQTDNSFCFLSKKL